MFPPSFHLHILAVGITGIHMSSRETTETEEFEPDAEFLGGASQEAKDPLRVSAKPRRRLFQYFETLIHSQHSELEEPWVERLTATLSRDGDPDAVPFQTVVAPANGALFERDGSFFTSVFSAADSLAKVRLFPRLFNLVLLRYEVDKTDFPAKVRP